MAADSLALRFVAPAVAALAGALAFRAGAEEPTGRCEVCRHRSADGRGSARLDLAALERSYKDLAARTAKAWTGFAERAQTMKDRAHHAGLRACEVTVERTVTLAHEVPPSHRKATLYLVTVRPKAEIPKILPESLPAEGQASVMALDAASIEDVAIFSKALKRRVTLASAEFARALGVRCRDARVTFSEDGRSATVREVAP